MCVSVTTKAPLQIAIRRSQIPAPTFRMQRTIPIAVTCSLSAWFTVLLPDVRSQTTGNLPRTQLWLWHRKPGSASFP